MKLYKGDWTVESDSHTATNSATGENIDYLTNLNDLPFLVAQMIREWWTYLQKDVTAL